MTPGELDVDNDGAHTFTVNASSFAYEHLTNDEPLEFVIFASNAYAHYLDSGILSYQDGEFSYGPNYDAGQHKHWISLQDVQDNAIVEGRIMPSTWSDAPPALVVGQSDSIIVTVINDGSGNKYAIDGIQQDALNLVEGETYVFDWSGASGHPFKFSTNADGTHGGGVEYVEGVVVDHVAFTTTITVAEGAPDLHYYCEVHPGMGGSAGVEVSANAVDS